MSYAIASASKGAFGNQTINAPPVRQSADMLRDYLREINARYVHASAEQEKERQVIGICFYCTADQYEDLGFCTSCGRNLLVEHNMPSSLRGLRRSIERDSDPLYASSFYVSRKSFFVERYARKITWHIATCLMLLIPYYLVCKVTLGDAFPSRLIQSYQTIEIAMENAASNAFQPHGAHYISRQQ
jgi:hypothetical protein